MVVRNCKAIKQQLHEETFIVEKIAEFGEEQYLVLANADRSRVIDYSAYQDFGLKKGDKVKTVYKKENCAGDQVLMILHPRYLLNQSYEFLVKGFSDEIISGFKFCFIIVGDDFGFEHRIRINDDDKEKFQSTIKCRVMGISPGKLNLMIEYP